MTRFILLYIIPRAQIRWPLHGLISSDRHFISELYKENIALKNTISIIGLCPYAVHAAKTDGQQ